MEMKTIVVVCSDVILQNAIDRSLKNIYQVVSFKGLPQALDYIYNSLPNLIVMDVPEDDPLAVKVLNDLKSDPMFQQLPVLAVLPDTFCDVDWKKMRVEDYIRRRDLDADFLHRVNLSVLRSERIVEINPLTRMPGNISISKAIQEMIDEKKEFALGYADLDYFKPFNDRYGFSRGDEVIKMTGRIILGVIQDVQSQGSFVGHIGGDDFVFIVDSDNAQRAASEIIRAFDSLISGMYDPSDLKQGFIKSFDRKGKATHFPVMGISIGEVRTHGRAFTHYGEITEIAAEMKKYAKQFSGSCFKVDQRNGDAPCAPSSPAVK